MSLEEEFILAVKESIDPKYLDEEHFNKERNDNPKRYYEDKYAEPIKEYFKKHNVESYEVNRNNRWKCISICSLLSSGRFCYLDFVNKDGVQFEKPLYNGIGNSHPTKMDAVIGPICYECKCNEITSKSHDCLRESYKNSSYFKELSIEYTIKEKTTKNSDTGKKETYKALVFSVAQLDINLKGNTHYNNLHFDLKQLICHIIAIAHENKDKKLNLTSLQYVFYTPNKEIIEKYPKVKKLYDELDDEIKAIWNDNSKIQKFCKNHGIKLEEPIKVQIGDIEDINYQKLYK